MRNTYIIDGVAISATSYNQAVRAAKRLKAQKKSAKLKNDAKLARTQFHAK